MTITVVDLRTDELVHREEHPGTADADALTTHAITLATKYNAATFFLKELVPLEKCPCCPDYLDRTITSKDIEREGRAMRLPPPLVAPSDQRTTVRRAKPNKKRRR
ncbi:MAG: hypothetical protein ACHREM_08955 [Polyangiales bacterium]